jgi:hypothetical protein
MKFRITIALETPNVVDPRFIEGDVLQALAHMATKGRARVDAVIEPEGGGGGGGGPTGEIPDILRSYLRNP